MGILTSKEFFGLSDKKQVETKTPPVNIVASPAKKIIEVEKDEIFEEGFTLTHPDVTPSNTMTCKIKLEIDGKDIPLEIERGKVFTKSKLVFKALLERGYIPSKNYEEKI